MKNQITATWDLNVYIYDLYLHAPVYNSIVPWASLPYGTDRLLPEAEVLETINVNGNKKIILFSKHVIIGVIMNTFYILKLH